MTGEARRPPTGDVTYLFTDLEGSTSLWERFPEAMERALERHDALLRVAIAAHGGFVFNTVGDAFHAAFDDPLDGLLTALDAQHALHAEDWARFGPAFPEVRVRMALHNGRATWRDGDYYGQALNRAARLEAAGHGGQILLSRSMRQRLPDVLPAGVGLRDLGEHRLKDLRHSEHICQVVAADLPDVTRALRTAGEIHHRDRIIVLEPEIGDAEPWPDEAVVVERNLDASLAALRSALTGESETVVFTAEQMREVANHRPGDLAAYRLSRIAAWSQPRYRLDGRFVGLTLLVDRGEDVLTGRWSAEGEPYDDLGELMAAVSDPALVVLGAPGAGKSTLLRRLELDVAIDALRGDGAGDVVTFFVPLNQYVSDGSAVARDPGTWLAERWAARHPQLPPLRETLEAGRMILLLDGLNEMPVGGDSAFGQCVAAWRRFVQQAAGDWPGNRIVFSCRSLDYSATLSSATLRVPQVRIEPLSDPQVRQFLALYGPGRWREVWAELEGTPQLDVLRSPYFLKLLLDQIEAEGVVAQGPAALFTGFVREALRREVGRDNPRFRSDRLLTRRDHRRIVQARRWKSPYDLPERGVLIPKLADLAFGMQDHSAPGEQSQVRIDYDDALDVMDDPSGEEVLDAGAALSVLDEDAGRDEVMFFHQLLQEYFAARALATRPDPDRVRVEWRAEKAQPPLRDVVEALDPADSIPPLPSTGWEETTVLAAAMAPEPEAFVRAVMAAHPALAARCAAQPEVRDRLSPGLVGDLRDLLCRIGGDAGTDLRYRVSVALRLGELGDPRFEHVSTPEGRAMVPPMVEIAGGRYPLGDGTSGEETPSGADLAPYALGRFPVTNAEWALFMAAGGYDDARWWEGPAAEGWRRGDDTSAGKKHNWRIWRERFREDPARLDGMGEQGLMAPERIERWRGLVAMDDAAFDAHLEERFPSERCTSPHLWADAWFSQPALPVVGVTWYEARAYCRWLADLTGRPFRLPTEVEWAAAARGTEGRRYAYGDTFDPERCNVAGTHVRQPTPIGAFPHGRTPEGLDDMTGNTFDWTDSVYGPGPDATQEPSAATGSQRVVRGGSFPDDATHAAASFRYSVHPALRHSTVGLRLACSLR